MAPPPRDEEDLLGHSLEAILEQTALPGQALAAGSVAALTVALAAALASAVARAQPTSIEAFGAATQAEGLRLRAADLVERNRAGFAEARAALSARSDERSYHDVRIGDAMSKSLEILETISGTAADVSELSAQLASETSPETRPDAAAAAVLAESGARVAVGLIEANLISVPDKGTHAAASVHLRAAEAARHRASAIPVS